MCKLLTFQLEGIPYYVVNATSVFDAVATCRRCHAGVMVDNLVEIPELTGSMLNEAEYIYDCVTTKKIDGSKFREHYNFTGVDWCPDLEMQLEGVEL